MNTKNIKLAITFEDENGNQFEEEFSVHPTVADYIQGIEDENMDMTEEISLLKTQIAFGNLTVVRWN